MEVTRRIGRFFAIAASAYLCAVAAGMALVAGMTAKSLLSSPAAATRDLASVVDEMWGVGRVAGEWFGPFGAVLALPLLWRTDLRRSLPFTAAFTICAAATSNLLPFAPEPGPVSIAASLLMGFGAAFAGMCVSAVRWPSAQTLQIGKQSTVALDSRSLGESRSSRNEAASRSRTPQRKHAPAA